MPKRPKPKPLLTAAAFVKAHDDLPPLLIKTLKIWGKLYPTVRFSPTRDAKDGKAYFTVTGLPDEVIDGLLKSGKPLPSKRKAAKKKAAKSARKMPAKRKPAKKKAAKSPRKPRLVKRAKKAARTKRKK